MSRSMWEGLAVGLLFAGVGLLVRLGTLRAGWPARYVDPDLPLPMRLGPFALLPLGLGILLTLPGLACSPGDCSQAVDLMWLAGLILAALGVIAFFVPFRVLKPTWLVEAERSGGEEEILRQGATHVPLALSAIITAIAMSLVGSAILAGWVTWSFGTAIIVLGISIAGFASWMSRHRG